MQKEKNKKFEDEKNENICFLQNKQENLEYIPNKSKHSRKSNRPSMNMFGLYIDMTKKFKWATKYKYSEVAWSKNPNILHIWSS